MKIYIAGDSTATNQENKPFAGWGQMMQQFFKPNAVIDNRAMSGRSTKSFIAEKRLDAILSEIKAGDYLLVQFGHNDQKDNQWRTDPFTTYTEILKIYVDAAREKGALPVLLSPVYRRRFDENGIPYDTHGDYPEAVRRLAVTEEVPFLDLHRRSRELVVAMGVEKSKDIFLHIAPGVYERHPDGIKDDTHFSEYGAMEVAKLVIDEIRANVPGLVEWLP